MILVGGHSKSLEISKKHLEFIVSQLIKAAEILKITFTVTAQKILHHNDATDEDINICIYNKIFEKADILHRYIYGQPLNADLLDVSLSDLKKTSAFESSADSQIFLQLLWKASAVMGDPDFVNTLYRLRGLFENKNLFIALLGQQFCDYARVVYEKALKSYGLLSDASQTCFAINITNGELFSIPQHTFIPNEFYRKLNTLSCNYVSCHEEGRDKCNKLPEEIRKSIVASFPPSEELPKTISLAQIERYINKYGNALNWALSKYLLARDILNLMQDDAALLYQNNQPAAAHEVAESKKSMVGMPCMFFKIPNKPSSEQAMEKFKKRYKQFEELVVFREQNNFVLQVPTQMVRGLIQSMFSYGGNLEMSSFDLKLSSLKR